MCCLVAISVILFYVLKQPIKPEPERKLVESLITTHYKMLSHKGPNWKRTGPTWSSRSLCQNQSYNHPKNYNTYLHFILLVITVSQLLQQQSYTTALLCCPQFPKVVLATYYLIMVLKPLQYHQSTECCYSNRINTSLSFHFSLYAVVCFSHLCSNSIVLQLTLSPGKKMKCLILHNNMCDNVCPIKAAFLVCAFNWVLLSLCNIHDSRCIEKPILCC